MSNDTATDPSAARKRACLEAAINACCGDRALNYGAPEDNFRRIADLWNAWWNVRVPSTDDTAPFGPVDVAVMNILLKIARLANTPSHNDSWIDIAGYAACGADITRSGAQKVAPVIDNFIHCEQCELPYACVLEQRCYFAAKLRNS
jgi:hypothetical protein